MTELKDFYEASSLTDPFYKQQSEVFCKKDILKNIYKISRENTCIGVCFRLSLKETPTQVFSGEICKIVKNTCFEEYVRTTVSALPWIYKT